MIYSYLLLVAYFSVRVNGNKYAELVHDRLELEGEISGLNDPKNLNALRRRLGSDESSHLNADFSFFEGDWYDCMHTTLMTFNGEPADKHIIEQHSCDYGKLGSVSKVGENDQTLMFDIHLLNHCWFHNLGGKGQKPCPNDQLDSDSRGDGNVLVKYSFKGIGSFADTDRIEFFSDHTYSKNEKGNWKVNHARAKIENMDSMVCRKHWAGMVCDWKINEYRTSTEEVGACSKNKKCHSTWSAKKCKSKGGTMAKTKGCKKIKSTLNAFVYDSFGSYYLVKDIANCNLPCSGASNSPSSTSSPTAAPGTKTWGCYRGGKCGQNAHGCCDCTIKSKEKCDESGKDWTTKPIWSDGCNGICKED